MPRYKLPNGNVIVADQSFIDANFPGALLLQDPPPPAQVAAWPAYDFYRRFTQAERIAIRQLAATDPAAMDFMQTLDHTIASGSRVLANDPDLQAGLTYLQAHPAGTPVLTAARAAALLAP